MTDPFDFAARWAEFRAAYEQEKFADALALLRAFPEDRRSEFQLVAHEADLLGKLGDPEGEIALLRKLTEQQPMIASLWASIATAQNTLGRSDEAVVSLRHAIAIDPAYGKPWWQLSELRRFRFDDVDIATMATMLASDLSPTERAQLHFALAKAEADRGEANTAFDHYAAGNALRAATLDPRASSMTPRVDRSIALFSSDFLASRADWGAPSPVPIFIVGLQRSGSTLIEQILSSHPSIEGLSELPLMPQLNRELALDPALSPGDLFGRMAALGPDQWRAIGQAYLDRAAAFRCTDRPHFVDKLPGNWTNIGLIRLALPNAKIIDARRHPLATGFSNFKQNYGTGAAFSYDLATIGRYYRDYLRLVTHFERVDPVAIHRVVNEALIDDFESQVRALLDYVGVPFDPACLTFHTNARVVRTPSAEQVRRPINRDGVDQWRAFEPWLGELKQALGSALDNWDLLPGRYRDEDD
ncbi:MAG: sulfotransferase [Sphingomonas bacterium]|nr:sulfotransferase [Sphingomonas bacterium]